jgi:NAD(P)-dependent dehydrogenase (short-subunit alcohol dehydrogenase family)
MEHKVALITGASRGIGKVTALALARAGYAIVATARTLREGEGTIDTPYAGDQRQLPVAGSLQQTVADIEAIGGQAIAIPMDITDRATIDAAIDAVKSQWGRIDLLMNNGAYQGPGLMFRMMEVDIAQMEVAVIGNCINQFYLTQQVLPLMIAQGAGVVFNMTSHAGIEAPVAPTGEGGWGYVHAAAKGGFHRMVGVLDIEHRGDGVRGYNIEPGFTMTEALKTVLGEESALAAAHVAYTPEQTAEVICWLAQEDVEGRYSGRDIHSPSFFETEGVTD